LVGHVDDRERALVRVSLLKTDFEARLVSIESRD